MRRLQPESYHAFRCVGAECEDTCCIGWNVNVDKRTYDAYQSCQDPTLGPRLRELVAINIGGKSDDDYARIALTSEGCLFLKEQLCSIHRTLGEAYLSNMCATYPRILNVVDDVLERSLDLACPEAARIVLTNPSPMEFDRKWAWHMARTPPSIRLFKQQKVIPGSLSDISTTFAVLLSSYCRIGKILCGSG